jgi:ankyrin repeat protein
MVKMACTHTEHCELFAQFALNPALQIWQSHYCQGDFKRCVRFQMSVRGESVPLNLLPNGSRVEMPRSSDDYGATALFNAILKMRVSMVESLLKHGIDINIRNSDGMTPLMAAASTGNMQIIRIILAKGADTHAISTLGENAGEMAARMGHTEAEKLLRIAKAGSARPHAVPETPDTSRSPKGLFGFLRGSR